MFTCPVCFFDKMAYPPREYNICECCGTEFENDDEYQTHEELRADWEAKGGAWFFENPPRNWNPWIQLYQANALVIQSTNFVQAVANSTPFTSVSREVYVKWNEVHELALAS